MNFFGIYKPVVIVTRVCVHIGVRILASITPRFSHKVVVGAWNGELYCDNPRFFTEYTLKHKREYKIYWIGNEDIESFLPKDENLHFVKKGSLMSVYHLLTSKFWYCCLMAHRDFTKWPLMTDFWGMKIIDSWHGIPIKMTGSVSPSNVRSFDRATFLQRIYHKFLWQGSYEWLTVASDRMAEILSAGESSHFTLKRSLGFGTPRNDFLIHNLNDVRFITSLKEKYANMLKFSPKKKIVLYLPTWRITDNGVFCFHNLPKDEQMEVNSILDKNNAVLIEKHHPVTYKMHPVAGRSHCSIVVPSEMQKFIDTQELLLISDVLISDYSGAFVDFGLLKRPAIHFAYDYEEYMRTDGMSYNLKDVAIGTIVTDQESLFKEIEKMLNNPECKQSPGYADVVKYEHGDSCRKIHEFMLGRKS